MALSRLVYQEAISPSLLVVIYRHTQSLSGSARNSSPERLQPLPNSIHREDTLAYRIEQLDMFDFKNSMNRQVRCRQRQREYSDSHDI